jgi:hypothetical protein
MSIVARATLFSAAFATPEASLPLVAASYATGLSAARWEAFGWLGGLVRGIKQRCRDEKRVIPNDRLEAASLGLLLDPLLRLGRASTHLIGRKFLHTPFRNVGLITDVKQAAFDFA